MKKMKKLIGTVAVLGVLGAGGAVFASEIFTPAQIAADLTGKSVAEVTEERAEGKTYGTIASEADKLEEFRSQMLEQKKAILDQRVKDGAMTQEQADQVYNAIKENQALCDGTGNGNAGLGCGAGFGRGNGNGLGQGRGQGMGKGLGCGAGLGKWNL
ncbi:MAG: DUF2680 domain-containing protein [Dehalobacterium sp.]